MYVGTLGKFQFITVAEAAHNCTSAIMVASTVAGIVVSTSVVVAA